MIDKFNAVYVTVFGVGKIKFAPGTIASLLTTLFLFYSFHIVNFSKWSILLSIFIIFFYSFYAVSSYIDKRDDKDPKEIVIDELVGQSIPILTIYCFVENNDIYNFILYTFFSFTLFRFFDIAKPYPINKIDRYMKNGFGVMLDDIVAGIYASIILIIIILFGNYV